MNELLIVGHLGMGDHLVTNALVRHFAATRQVVVPAKYHHVASCQFMFRDEPKIAVFGVRADRYDFDTQQAALVVERAGHEVLRLGSYRPGPRMNAKIWDQEMYRQAGVPFETSWTGFHVRRQPDRELMVVDTKSGDLRVVEPGPQHQWTRKPYIFVHDDPARKFRIRKSRLPDRKAVVRPVVMPGPLSTIFDWWEVLARAEEIHVMDSSFAILADRLPDLKAKKFVLHFYARRDKPPTYHRPWEILK